MAELWPTALPCAWIAGTIRHSRGETNLRSENATGPAKVRRRSTSSPDPYQGSMRLTTAEWEALIAFYEDDLLSGSLVFTMPLRGYAEDQEVRFTKPPERQDSGPGKWQVTFSLEIMP